VRDESLGSINKRFGPNPLGVKSNRYRLWHNFNEFVATKQKLDASFRAILRELIPT